MTDDLAARARRGSREKFEAALAEVFDVEPEEPDLIPLANPASPPAPLSNRVGEGEKVGDTDSSPHETWRAGRGEASPRLVVRQQQSHPWTRRGFGLIVALLGVYSLLLALDNVLNAREYRDLGVSYPPLLRAALALGWGVPLLALGIGVLRRKRWARRWWLILLSNYGAFNVLWLIIFAESDFSRGRAAFQAVVTALLLGLAAAILRWRRVFACGDNA